MSYFSPETEKQTKRKYKFNDATSIALPLGSNPKIKFQEKHIMKTDSIQQSWEDLEERRAIEFTEDYSKEPHPEHIPPPDDLSSHQILSFCLINGNQYEGPPLLILMPLKLDVVRNRTMANVTCGTCRGEYLFDLRKRRDEKRAQHIEMIWLEKWGTINPDCGKNHYMTQTVPLYLACKRCGQLSKDLKEQGEKVHFPS